MKVSIIGAGNVGASLAHALLLREVCENIVLFDIVADFAKAKAIDLSQSATLLGLDTVVIGTDNFMHLSGSDIVVITAGSPRKQGQSRADLMLLNAKVVSESAKNVAIYAPKSIIIVVTNPLDEMVWVAWNASKFNPLRVIGMAGELDSARYKYFAKEILGLNSNISNAVVVGSHSDNMIPVRSGLNIDDDKFETIYNLTKGAGAQIVKMLGTSAYYAPCAGVLSMIENISGMQNKDIVATVLLKNGDLAFDEPEIASGRIIRLDRVGVKTAYLPNLNKDELLRLENSENTIKENIKYLKENLNLRKNNVN